MPQLVDRATYSRGRLARATPEQIEAWRSLVRAHAAATKALGAAIGGHDLDASEYDVLFTLSGGPPEGLRPTELSERGLLTKSGVTRLLDRLDERGLIERRACLSDARGQLIGLTPAGRRLLRRATPGLLRAMARIFAPLSAAEIAALRASTDHVKEAATAHSAE